MLHVVADARVLRVGVARLADAEGLVEVGERWVAVLGDVLIECGRRPLLAVDRGPDVDGDEMADAFRMARGVGDRVHAAHREGDQGEAVEGPGLHQRLQVTGAVLGGVGRLLGPGGVAVAALVGRQQVVASALSAGEVVPDTAHGAQTVEEDNGGRGRIAPLDVVEAQSARLEGALSRLDGGGHGREQLTPSARPLGNRWMALRPIHTLAPCPKHQEEERPCAALQTYLV